MEQGKPLKNPIDLRELLNGGTGFSLDADFKSEHVGNEFFLEDDFGSEDEDEDSHKQMMSPWTQSFDELRQQMEPVAEHIHKRIMKRGVGEPVRGNVRVTLDYNAFFEKEPTTFDSTTLRNAPYSFTVGKDSILEGLEKAVLTMCVSEEAQFVIGYPLLFGEVGCMPRIPPKADALFVVRLHKCVDVGDASALQTLEDSERRTYALVKKRVVEIRAYAKNCFQRNMIQNAIHKYLEAVDTLQLCDLKDAAETNEQQETLISLYTSLAVCYNRKDQPKDACRMINELRRLCDINLYAKILYQEGKALHRLGEFKRARQVLVRAQQLEPRDENIQRELRSLLESTEKFTEEERNICRRAFGMKDTQKKSVTAEQQAFAQMVKESMKHFMEDDQSTTLPLPDGLTDAEVNVLQEVADEMKVKLSVQVDNNKKNYKFQK
ncbi:inactive peptidyl-prolyl cis-trans isomerase shutdown-like [Anopheles darlingi]|uniref:inactive peptidyl-prolyl cis-trans isomerase shutdown-like n=1 Tax=Anopheles darlingi TaxID=43151 RepID=UPI0020FFFD29|nr:inactive peptidyl-prolyl cis-trans isomerase shutdown-like [Anopheles darlingi]